MSFWVLTGIFVSLIGEYGDPYVLSENRVEEFFRNPIYDEVIGNYNLSAQLQPSGSHLATSIPIALSENHTV